MNYDQIKTLTSKSSFHEFKESVLHVVPSESKSSRTTSESVADAAASLTFASMHHN